MTFNDLKKENKLFVVNQGDSFGMRIEEHIINDKLYLCNDTKYQKRY